MSFTEKAQSSSFICDIHRAWPQNSSAECLSGKVFGRMFLNHTGKPAVSRNHNQLFTDISHNQTDLLAWHCLLIFLTIKLFYWRDLYDKCHALTRRRLASNWILTFSQPLRPQCGSPQDDQTLSQANTFQNSSLLKITFLDKSKVENPPVQNI